MKQNISVSKGKRQLNLQAFDRLLDIMDKLREDCSWFKNQTWESLRHLTIEETYELSDAILCSENEEVKKELGDLMLHIVFYSLIAEEKKTFSTADVLNSISEKLIKRNPHIFGEATNKESQMNDLSWEKRKLNTGNTSVLQGIPNSMPALLKAIQIQEKVGGIGFEWESKKKVWQKVEEELKEFKSEYNDKNQSIKNHDKAMEEFGDIIFSLVNFARFIKINPETALELTNKKFIKRFQYLETEAIKDGNKMGEMTLAEMDKYWEKAKKETKK